RTAVEHGFAAEVEPWPVCLGYTSYLRCAAHDGALEGLTALYAAERAYLDTWTAVAHRSPADSAYHAWIQNWSAAPFRAVVSALGRDLDELAGAPSPALARRLGVLFAGAAPRAPDTDPLGRLVDLAHATFHQELSLHRGYAAEFGLGEADLDRAEKTPVCAAYTDFLLRTAATADFAEVLAALLPCMWGYSELGRAMARTGLPTDPRYRRWIQTYADLDFAALAAWC